MNKLLISPLAAEDLEGIRKYITEELQNPLAADIVLRRIMKGIKGLVASPQIGSPLSAIADIETDYRFLVCGNYTAFYRYEKPNIYIDRVLYGRRDFMMILFGKPMIDPEDDTDE